MVSSSLRKLGNWWAASPCGRTRAGISLVIFGTLTDRMAKGGIGRRKSGPSPH